MPRALQERGVGSATESSRGPRIPSAEEPRLLAGRCVGDVGDASDGAIAPRDGQATLSAFLDKTPLPQTDPCRDIKIEVQVSQ